MDEDREERLRQEVAEYADLTGRLSRLLTGVANALKGPPPEHVWHDWSDLPKVAAATVKEMGDAADQAMESGFKVQDLQEQLDNCARHTMTLNKMIEGYRFAFETIHEENLLDPDVIEEAVLNRRMRLQKEKHGPAAG